MVVDKYLNLSFCVRLRPFSSNLSFAVRCSLHLAMQHNSLDVVKVLLKYGVDPNEPQGLAHHFKSRRSSYQSSCGTDGSSPPVGTNLPGQGLLHQCNHSEQSERRLSPSPTLGVQSPGSTRLARIEKAEPKMSDDALRTADSASVTLSQSSEHRQMISQSSTKHGTQVVKCHLNQSSNHLPSNTCQNMLSTSPYSTHRPCYSSVRSKSLELPGRSPCIKRANSPVCHLPEIVETVIEDGFNFGIHYNREELFNLPCLYLAVVDGNSYFVQLLLRYGARPNTQDLYGCSPLHLACCPEFHNIDIIRILLRFGAKVHLKNAQADSPFTIWPEVLNEQRAVIRAALSRLSTFQLATTRSRTPSGPCNHFKESPPTLTPPQDTTISASNRSGSVSRFFKRLSSDPKSRPIRDKRSLAREESSAYCSEASRDRTYSTGSCKSMRSRLHSSYVQEDLDSDLSLLMEDVDMDQTRARPNGEGNLDKPHIL
ncbi:ankyrin repeat domain-containing protein 54 [Plakobranchus ocellatus]|uniref:Ankyrin repeat domain-containing protein 54 n=1 Tax=Plakobranchus ocellatus TaxID=259542 RepID=A0AAV3Z5J1_9GAST|nr:ankyrin repeat domain-containing protein 54 [Plakobranchus ocellatus]